MRKCLIWFLIFLVSFFPIFKKQPLIAHAATFEGGADSVTSAPLPTRAEGVDVPTPTPTTGTVSNSTLCAMANVLTWEILQTYLYAVTGQQAYDVYSNDEEKQQALYSDFVTFCQETSYGAKVTFQYNVATAITLKQAFEYYKTAGTSALKELQEDAKTQLQVIYGGLNNNNNDVSPAPSPTVGAIGIGKKQFCELLGSGALTKYVGDYITQLVNGERGEVSETFLNTLDIPENYFDGDYTIDESGNLYFTATGKGMLYVQGDGYYFFKDSNFLKWKEIALQENGTLKEDGRYALYLDKSTGIYHYNFDNSEPICYNIKFYWLYDNGNVGFFTSKLGNVFIGKSVENINIDIGSMGLSLAEETCYNIGGIPVFDNEEELNKFLTTGDYSGCINYFNGEIAKPSDWLNYDFSQISDKLDQILQALTTLPTITTDDLAGFAQGVGNAIVAGNVPAADPATQQQQMQQILEDTARDTATKSLADSAMSRESESGGDDDTPRPTKTVEEYENDQTIQNGTMVVDWHEFFPFCVPYDMVRLIKVLNAEPQAPRFETAIKYDKLNINVPVKLDLSQFDKAAEIFRLCETIMFILGLILVTRNLIRG